jgi:phosphohistidine phosphatase SixA
LKGKALVEALRGGGFVLFMRHAQQVREDPDREKRDCDDARLSTTGQEQARTVGAALRALQIPIGTVLSSEYCRARQTAELVAVGPVTVTADLNMTGPFPERKKRIATPPTPATNTLLVSHSQVEIAEIVVYKPDGYGGAEPLARIKVSDWKALGSGT